MNGRISNLMASAIVSALVGTLIGQAAFASHNKTTTITTKSYGTPTMITTPVVIEQSPITTTRTTTVRRTTDAPVIIESQPVIMERQEFVSTPVIQERRVEIMNSNSLPSSTSTTVTRTSIEAR